MDKRYITLKMTSLLHQNKKSWIQDKINQISERQKRV